MQTEKEIKIKGNRIYRDSLRCGDGLLINKKMLLSVTNFHPSHTELFTKEDGFFHLAPNSIE